MEVVVDPEPYTVVGDRIFMSGSSYLSAGGAVVIERDSLLAFADSAEYEGATDELVLQGSARVESAAYELVGRTITMATVAAETDEVRALREAVLTGDHLRLTAPQIVAHITDGVVEELVAIPLPSDPSAEPDSADSVRPVALAQEFELTADSLQLTSPRDVLERIFAAGTARSVAHARDSLNVESLPEIARTDWLEGDTIVVTFAPATSAGQPDDTTSEEEFEVERIVARLGARSLYRLAPSDTTAQIGVDPPAVHYVIGDTITILMSSGEVEGMEVIGQTQGVHLEPLGAEPPDTVPELEELQADTASASGANPAGDGNKPSEPAAPIREVEPWRRP